MGLEPEAGQRVLHIILEAIELGTFDKQKYGAFAALCPFSCAEAAEQRVAALEKALRELHDCVLARYEGKNGHRDWWIGGTWMHPGDLLIEANETDFSALAQGKEAK